MIFFTQESQNMPRSLLAALAALLALPAIAWSAPTIVGDHYEDNKDANCANSTVCRLTFDATPAGKFLMIERVNCHTVYAQPILQSVMLSISTTPTGPMMRFKWVPVTALGGGAVTDYVADLETRQLMGPVRYPNIVLRSSSAYYPYVTCSIIGTLQNM